MFMVKLDMWTSDHEDYYDFEYTGDKYENRKDAEDELFEAKQMTKDDPTIKSIYIMEVN